MGKEAEEQARKSFEEPPNRIGPHGPGQRPRAEPLGITQNPLPSSLKSPHGVNPSPHQDPIVLLEPLSVLDESICPTRLHADPTKLGRVGAEPRRAGGKAEGRAGGSRIE